MAAPLVASQRVDFIDDDGAGRCEHVSARFRAEKNVQRLRRRDHDVRWPAPHQDTFLVRCVPGADQRSNVDVRHAEGLEFRAYAGQWRREVALDIIGKRLERRDVDHRRLVGQRRVEALSSQLINGGQECGERLPRSRWGCNQDVLARLDERPRERLWFGSVPEFLGEPLLDGRMKAGMVFHGRCAARINQVGAERQNSTSPSAAPAPIPGRVRVRGRSTCESR